MHNLFIDTTNRRINLAWFNQEEILAFSSIETKTISEDIDQELNRFFKRNHLKKEDISSIYFLSGPGSYIGTRITSTLIKAWALVYPNVTFYEIGSLELQKIDPKQISVISKSKNSSYVLENNKVSVYSNQEIETKFKDKNVVTNFSQKSISKMLLINLSKFRKIKDVLSFEIAYYEQS